MKFNKEKTTTKVVNRAGGQAYKQSTKLEFVSILLTSFVKNEYYRSAEDTMATVSQLIKGLTDKEFAAKAAIYARDKFGMRSITHVTAGELFRDNQVTGKSWVKNFINKVVIRPDDAMEILAYFSNKVMTKTMPNQLKKGLSLALQKFDEYSLSKYKGGRKEFSLVDIINLTHPKGNKAISALVKGTLKPADTWETKLTQAGQKAETEEQKEELKADAWKSLILTGKIGYMALVRNLRNIIKQADKETLEAALELLVDKNRIKKSRIFPFQILTATRILQNEGIAKNNVLKALNEALEISVDNVPVFEGSTLVVVDHSGSMESKSHSNQLTNFEIGALFGAALSRNNDADFMYFGTLAKHYSINPNDSLTTTVDVLKKLNSGGGYYSESISGTNVGHGTNFNAIFETANKKYDRILIFSDMQGWVGYHTPDTAVAKYKKQYDAQPHIYSVDLCGYGDMQFPEKQVYALAGFSDKMFDIMALLETDKEAMVHAIEEVQI